MPNGNKDNITDTITNMEPSISSASLGKKKMSRFNTPVCIIIHSYRHRLVDTDGISAKAAIDGLVKDGILTNDTPEQITEISFKQTKIPRTQDEKTEIIISSHKAEGEKNDT